MDDPTPRLRALCLSFPETSERQSHGEAAWFWREKRQFATMSDHHHDDRVALWCAAQPGAQQVLVEADPTRYFRPPYVGHRGWLGVYLDVEVDWPTVEDLIRQAYELVSAPRR